MSVLKNIHMCLGFYTFGAHTGMYKNYTLSKHVYLKDSKSLTDLIAERSGIQCKSFIMLR